MTVHSMSEEFISPWARRWETLRDGVPSPISWLIGSAYAPRGTVMYRVWGLVDTCEPILDLLAWFAPPFAFVLDVVELTTWRSVVWFSTKFLRW